MTNKYRNSHIVSWGIIWVLLVFVVACTPPTGGIATVSPGEGATRLPQLGASALRGTKWKLVALGSPQEPEFISGGTIKFDLIGRNVTGDVADGCNHFSGKYATDGQNITLSNLSSTLKGCLKFNLVNVDYRMYLEALRQAHSFSLTEETLLIHYDQQAAIYFLPDNTDNSLVNLDGSRWSIKSIQFEEPYQSVSNLRAAGLTIDFAGGQVSGFTGCQIFSTSYSLRGDRLEISGDELDHNLADCPNVVAAHLHNLFMTALAEVENIQMSQGSIYFSGANVMLHLEQGPLPPPFGWESAVAWTVVQNEFPEVIDQSSGINSNLAYNQPGVNLEDTLEAVESTWDIQLEPTLLAHFVSRNSPPRESFGSEVTAIPILGESRTYRDAGYADEGRILTFSRVGFREDGRQALIYVGDDQGRSRTGRYFLLEWDGQWQIVKEMILWEDSQESRPVPTSPTPSHLPGDYPPPLPTIDFAGYPSYFPPTSTPYP